MVVAAFFCASCPRYRQHPPHRILQAPERLSPPTVPFRPRNKQRHPESFEVLTVQQQLDLWCQPCYLCGTLAMGIDAIDPDQGMTRQATPPLAAQTATVRNHLVSPISWLTCPCSAQEGLPCAGRCAAGGVHHQPAPLYDLVGQLQDAADNLAVRCAAARRRSHGRDDSAVCLGQHRCAHHHDWWRSASLVQWRMTPGPPGQTAHDLMQFHQSSNPIK